MGFEYFPRMGCGVQDPGSDSDFRIRAKTRSMLQSFSEMKQSGERNFTPETKVHIPFSIGPNPSAIPSLIQLKDLVAFWQSIEAPARPICAGCPANLKGGALGCYAAITYPISAQGEAWLLNQFNPVGGDGGYVPHHIKYGKITGELVDSSRGGLLESPKPFVKHIGDEAKGYTSSQLMHFIFACCPEAIPQTLFGLCADFGAIQITEGQSDEVTMLLLMYQLTGGRNSEEETSGEWKRRLGETIPFQMKLDPTEDRSIFKFKEFFLACWTAFICDASLVVDG